MDYPPDGGTFRREDVFGLADAAKEIAAQLQEDPLAFGLWKSCIAAVEHILHNVGELQRSLRQAQAEATPASGPRSQPPTPRRTDAAAGEILAERMQALDARELQRRSPRQAPASAAGATAQEPGAAGELLRSLSLARERNVELTRRLSLSEARRHAVEGQLGQTRQQLEALSMQARCAPRTRSGSTPLHAPLCCVALRQHRPR